MIKAQNYQQQQIMKNDLLEFQEEYAIPTYDPYRMKNILKDSNTINAQSQMQLFRKTTNIRYTYSNNMDHQQNNTIQTPSNCRKSLKKLLERLEAIPSPQKPNKNISKTQNTLDVFSITQNALVQHKKNRPKSRPQRKNLQNKRNTKKNGNKSFVGDFSQNTKLQINNRPLKTMSSSSQTQMCIKKHRIIASNLNNEQKVRKLIQQKIAQKKLSLKAKKTSNLLNFIRQNNSTQLENKAVHHKQERLWDNPRKLTNILLFK